MSARDGARAAAVYEYPAALDGLALERSGLVEASAGTGKTYLLEHLFVHLLLQTDATADGILVVTFTERATAELALRIAARLDQVLGHQERAERGWRLDETARAKLVAARAALERASISTIHGFCQRVLAEQPFLTKRLVVGGPTDGAQLFAASFREVLRTQLACDPTFAPYLEAWLAQGKDVATLERAVRRARSLGVPLAHPFSPRRLIDAARVFLATQPDGCLGRHEHTLIKASVGGIERRLGPLCELVNHALALGGGSPAGDDREPALLDRQAAAFLGGLDEDLLAFFQFASGNEENPRKGFFAPDLTRDPKLALVQQATRDLLRAAPPLLSVLVERALPPLEAHLAGRKLADGTLDFDDLIRFVADGVEGEGGPALVASLRNRYRFALVDEFQDTDPRQWRIFRKVFFESGGANPLFLVGDPKQAIYGFRSADVHTYVDARQTVLAAGGSRVDLVANFRSSPPLIGALNRLFDQDAALPFFQESPYAPSITYRPPATAGRPAAHDGEPPLTLLRVEAMGGASPPRMPDVKRALLWTMAQDLAETLARDPGLLDADRGVFILTRTTAEMLEVGEMLAAHGLPYHFHREERLLSGQEAQDVLALLRALREPDEPALRLGAWLTPFFGLALDDLPAARDVDPFHPLVASLKRWSRLAADRAFASLFAELLDTTGLSRRLIAEDATSGLRKLGAYRQLFAFLLRLQSRGQSDLGSLVARFEGLAARTLEPEDPEDDIYPLTTEGPGVEVMTMHRAKGLEADRVYLFGAFAPVGIPRTEPVTFLDPGTAEEPETAGAPSRRVLGFGRPAWRSEQRALKAERASDDQRLMYVALTRARRNLVLPYFPSVRSVVDESWVETSAEQHDLFERLNGGYRHVNRRLDELRDDPAFQAHATTKKVPFPLPRESLRMLDRPRPSVPPALAFEAVAAAGVPDPQAASFEEQRRRSAGVVIASYTRLQGLRHDVSMPGRRETVSPGLDAEHAVPGADLSAAEAELADEAPSPWAGAVATWTDEPLAAETLAGGAAAGVLLHALLEVMPLAAPRPWDTFCQDPAILRLADRELARHGRDPREREAALKLVHTALAHAWPTGGLRPLPYLGAAARVIREMEFLYPARTGANAASTLVKGFIDVLFEHEGRVYLADWKSDQLSDFGASSLAARVATHYDLQVRLYTRAVARMLGLTSAGSYAARFGGMVFAFLRGLSPGGPPDEGMILVRPSWDELEDETRDMRLG